jgi:hypothetical protein
VDLTDSAATTFLQIDIRVVSSWLADVLCHGAGWIACSICAIAKERSGTTKVMKRKDRASQVIADVNIFVDRP